MFAAHLPRGLFCILLWALAHTYVHAAESDPPLSGFQITKWSQKDGLPGTDIRRIAQTSDGYLWFTTESGLVRFDGVRFVSVPIIPEMPNEGAVAMFAAADDSLWVGTMHGGVVHISHGVPTYYRPGGGLVDGQAKAIFEDRHGMVWVGTADGLSRLEKDHWRRFGIKDGFLGHRVTAILEDSAGSVWVGSDAGVLQWMADQQQFVAEPGASNYINCLSKDSTGVLWVSDADRGLHPLHKTDRDFVHWKLGTAVFADQRKNLWIRSYSDGLRRISSNGQRERLTMGEGLSNAFVQALLEDREGNLWIGTQNGLNRLRPINFLPLQDPHVADNFLRDIAATPDGGLWVIANPYIYRLRDGVARVYPTPGGIQGTVFSADGLQPLLLGSTRYLAQLRGRRFVSLPMPKDAPLGLISDIARDGAGGLWLADYKSGLVHWDRGVLKPFPEFAGRSVRRVVVDSLNRVWVGAGDGLWEFNSGRFRHYKSVDGGVEDAIREIYLGWNDALWAATTDRILRFKDGQMASFLPGLPSGSINSVVEDKERSLWVVHSAGLFRIPAAEFERAFADMHYRPHVGRFDESDGLPAPPPSLQGHFAARADNGTLWFALRRGAVSVDPARLTENRIVPPVVIEGAQADQRPVVPAPALRLAPRTRSLQIDYTALSFTAPEKVRFKTKLEGLDSDWVDQGSIRRAFYTNLAPGAYRFRVIACNSDGIWNEAGAAWEFSVAPAFSQTKWFLALCGATCVGLLWGGYRLRMRQIETRNRVLVEQRVAERTRMARELHDTLVQNITGLSLQIGGLARASGAESFRDRLENLRREAEECLREARQSVWNLRSQCAERRDLVRQLRDCGERLATGKPLRFTLWVRGKPRALSEHVEQHILRIGQEAITNAVRHSNAREIRAEIRFEDSALRLLVCDDGNGFEFDENNDGTAHWGLVTMRERAQQIGARFKISSSRGGTEVEAVVSLTRS